MSSLITVDDRDLDCEGGCYLGPHGPDPHEYHHTNTVLEYGGSTIIFRYTGTYIAVYGTLRNSIQSKLSCVLDGGSPNMYTAPVTNQTLYHVLFCEMTPQENGFHTLIVTDIGDASTTIDYVKYMPGSPATTTITPSALSSAIPPLSSGTESGTVTANNNVRSRQMKIVGGALLTAVVLTLLLFLHRRWRRWMISSSDMNAAVEPYGSSRTPPIVSHSKSLQNINPATSALSTSSMGLSSGQDIEQGQGWSQGATPVPMQPHF